MPGQTGCYRRANAEPNRDYALGGPLGLESVEDTRETAKTALALGGAAGR